MRTPTILLVDDHAILLDGLRMLMASHIDGAEVITAHSLSEAIKTRATPDVIVLDIKLPGINGLEGVAPLQRKWPQVQIVILSSLDDPTTQEKALSLGVSAFHSKADDGERIVETIQKLLLRGKTKRALTSSPTLQPQHLSPRQCEVLDLLCQGLSNKLIANRMNISNNTVRRHLQDIFSIFGVANRTEAIFEARRRGLIH